MPDIHILVAVKFTEKMAKRQFCLCKLWKNDRLTQQ